MPKDSTQDLRIERKGGLAGAGLPGSRIKSRGVVDLRALSPADREAIERLFKGASSEPSHARGHADDFQYYLTRSTPGGDKTVVVSGDDVPEAVRNAVEDEIE